MKPNNEMCTRWFPREFYCALGPTEILATLRDEEQHGVDHPLIWESYKLDEARPVIGEWPYPEDTDEEILEKLNDDECKCLPTPAMWWVGSGTINFVDPIRFGSWVSPVGEPRANEGVGNHYCAATIECTDCHATAVMRLVLRKRWYEGYEDKAILIGTHSADEMEG